MAVKYIILVKEDDGTQRSFGNIGAYELKVKSIKHIKKDRTAILNVILDNKNNEFNNQFTQDNEIDFYVANDGGGSWGLPVTFEVPSTLGEQPTFFRFSGEVSEVVPNEDNTQVTLICKGENDVLSQRSWSGSDTNVDLGQHIVNVLTEEASEIDTSTINTSTGIILDEVRGDAIFIRDHFDDLFRENNYQLDIGPDLVATLFENNRGSSGITLIDGASGNVIKGSNKLRESNLSKKNTVTVIGGSETVVDFDEDQITWNTGDSTNIVLRHRIDTLGFVKFGGVTKVEDTDFTIGDDRITITLLTQSNGDTIDIRYNYKSPVWWREQDPSTVKVKELVIKDDTILTQSRAEELAKASLAKVGIRVTKGSISSDKITKDFKWFETLDLNLQAFSGSHKIIGFTEDVTDDYKVTFEIAEVLDDNARKILQIIKDVDKLKGADITTVTIKDGFTLTDEVVDSETIEGFETPRGTRFTYDVSTWDSGDTYDTGEGTETQWL